VQSSPPPGDYVPIYVKGGSAWVDVQLGSLTKRMLIDTGATYITVTKSVADDLLRRGDAVRHDPGAASDFEGWTHIENRIQILTLGVGDHTLHNVLAGVVPDEAEMLLGFPALNQVGRFTIDTKNRQLIFD
jgi:predicted aspartyl protease